MTMKKTQNKRQQRLHTTHAQGHNDTLIHVYIYSMCVSFDIITGFALAKLY